MDDFCEITASTVSYLANKVLQRNTFYLPVWLQ